MINRIIGELNMYENMSQEEMINRIKELEKENQLLRGIKPPTTMSRAIHNQKELDFIFPSYGGLRNSNWHRSSIADLSSIRKMALSTVYPVNEDNVFKELKMKELPEEDFDKAVACADELIQVIAKYKKQYLLEKGREDIVKAFDM